MDLIKYKGDLVKRVGDTISITNKLLIPDLKLIPYFKKYKWGFCTMDKKIVIDCVYDKVELFSEGVAVVQKLGKYGFIDINGNITNDELLRHFQKIDSLNEGLSRAGYCINKWEWGFVDKDNMIIIPIIYDNVSDFSEGLARVNMNKKWGFINKDNVEVVPIIYDNVHSYFNGVANVRMGEKWGVIDKLGKIIIPIEKSWEELKILNGESEGISQPKIIEIENKYSLVDRSGKQINKKLYDCIDSRGFGFVNGLIDVQLNDKWGFIDIHGNEIISCMYDDVYPFFEGLAGVLDNEEWGFIDTNGYEVIPHTYSEVFPFENDIALVTIENKGKFFQGYINKQGVEYWEF